MAFSGIFFLFVFLNDGVKTTELNRHGTHHSPPLSRRQRRWRRSELFQPAGQRSVHKSYLNYICLLLPHHYLHMRIALSFRKNCKKGFGNELCLFLLPLLGEVCRQKEHTLPILCSRGTVKYSRASEDMVLVKLQFKQG